MRASIPFLLTLILTGAAGFSIGSTPTGSGATQEPIEQEPIEGSVREAAGPPLSSARVELRVDGVTVASTRTDEAGRFRLSPGRERSGQWTILVSRLGYEEAEVSVSDGVLTLEIALQPAPLPIPGFRVELERASCPSEAEDGSARTLWERAAARHPGGLDTLGVASYTHVRTDTLSGDIPTTRGLENASPGQRASAPLLRLSWTRRIDREGYAFAVRRSGRTRSYDSWSYPPLEADFSPHFGGESFGRRHDFYTELADLDGWILRFCGRDTEAPYLEGILELGPDTLIRRAEWRFHTPTPDEEAGGWTRFPPSAEDGSPPPLLPVESMTWRSLPDGEVVRRAQWYDGWAVVAGDSVPFLPRRAEDSVGTD